MQNDATTAIVMEEANGDFKCFGRNCFRRRFLFRLSTYNMFRIPIANYDTFK